MCRKEIQCALLRTGYRLMCALRLPLTKADQWFQYRSEMLWQKLLRAEGTIRETHS